MANIADRFEAQVVDRPDTEAVVVQGGRRLTYAELDERASRFAAVLEYHGVGRGDRVGVHLPNTNEHLEVLLGCFKRRAAPVNLNTRFLPSELADVIVDSGAAFIVDDVAVYEQMLDGVRPAPPESRSGDDEYVLYTGGTTGRPKGVVWRHDDLCAAALGGVPDLEGRRILVACPLFHGTGQWMALAGLLAGATVLLSPSPHVDADELWRFADEERATHLVIVGDAYALPLADAAPREPIDSLTVILSGGATLSPDVTTRLLERQPTTMVVDGYGATETGGHARIVRVYGAPATTSFVVDDDTAVLDDDLRPLPVDEPTEGWLARRGPLPIGYAGDPELTAQTFATVDGVRWAIPGDRARWAGRHRVEILGRGNLTVNTGGEKVHVEEVETVLRRHADVADAVVVGTPDDRWGEVVTAVVQPRPGAEPSLDELAGHCRRHLAAFKVPRRLVLVDRVRRSVSGKPDYHWARALGASR